MPFCSFAAMSNKPTIPKGTRDFGPEKMAKRYYIIDNIKLVFQKYGFMPLETPSMENLSVLTGKYGDEGDQLLFKVLNSADFLKGVDVEDFHAGAKAMSSKISSKGLRYDLTVPFARYVVMNRNDITLPFKRYQIQPVWRGDNPQKGRYREFYQCDADVVGTNSLICETEIILMINEVFARLGITDFSIKVNHRKILAGITEYVGAQGKETDFFVALDKLDKKGWDSVSEELSDKGFDQNSLDKIKGIIALDGANQDKIETLSEMISDSESGKSGLEDLKEVLDTLKHFNLSNDHLELDLSLARGLSYYTGTIFEVKVNNVSIGSVSGGGRYDDLTGVFGLKGLSGIGFSFGVDRLFDVLEELDLFPEEVISSSEVLITYFDDESKAYGLSVLGELRKQDISAEIYPDSAKIKKQLGYADKKSIPYVVLIGQNEVKSGQLSVKDMKQGTQDSLSVDALVSRIKG
ncbi:MAG: histidine--tRNA ligase [Bacteroidota bacterium]